MAHDVKGERAEEDNYLAFEYGNAESSEGTLENQNEMNTNLISLVVKWAWHLEWGHGSSRTRTRKFGEWMNKVSLLLFSSPSRILFKLNPGE